MAELAKNSARAAIRDNCKRSAWPWPKTVTMAAEPMKAAMTKRRVANSCVPRPSSRAPRVPPMLAQTSTPLAAEWLKPMSATIFGIHFMMK